MASFAIGIKDTRLFVLADEENYRIVFAGLMEDDADIRKALRNLYSRFQSYISSMTQQHREQHGIDGGVDADTTAWALMGLQRWSTFNASYEFFRLVTEKNSLAWLVRNCLKEVSGIPIEAGVSSGTSRFALVRVH